jgi:hypothetical protein
VLVNLGSGRLAVSARLFSVLGIKFVEFIYQLYIQQEAILLEDWFAPNDTTNPQTSL